MEKREEHKIRELAWVIYTAPHQDPKKMKKTKEKFWPIEKGGTKEGPTDKMIERIRQAQEQYKKDLEKLKNGRGKE